VADVPIGDTTISNVTFPWGKDHDVWSNQNALTEAYTNYGGSLSDGSLMYYGGQPAIYWNGQWRKLVTTHSNQTYNNANAKLGE
jgi:hypothetical protein